MFSINSAGADILPSAFFPSPCTRGEGRGEGEFPHLPHEFLWYNADIVRNQSSHDHKEKSNPVRRDRFARLFRFPSNLSNELRARLLAARHRFSNQPPHPIAANRPDEHFRRMFGPVPPFPNHRRRVSHRQHMSLVLRPIHRRTTRRIIETAIVRV